MGHRKLPDVEISVAGTNRVLPWDVEAAVREAYGNDPAAFGDGVGYIRLNVFGRYHTEGWHSSIMAVREGIRSAGLRDVTPEGHPAGLAFNENTYNDWEGRQVWRLHLGCWEAQ